MRTQILFLSLSAALTATACNAIECADGTIERDGKCVASDMTPSVGKCGPFTELVGGECVPILPPTQCDPGSTDESTDPETGITTCVGNGGVVVKDCSVSLTCSSGSSSTKQTICGQIYDFKDDTKFAASGATGAKCNPDAPTATGPCALQIKLYDAVDFADGGGTPAELNVKDVYIDDCGRYKLTDVDVSTVGAYVGIGVDDANMVLGPAGITVTTAVATAKAGGGKTDNLDAFMVSATVASGWAQNGGPNFGTTGIYAPIFRAKKSPTDRTVQAGVTVQKSGADVMANDFYFGAAATDRTAVDTAATATGANGTALINNAAVMDLLVWGGRGGLGTGCTWEAHAGATLPGIVFVQVFRKADKFGMTCAD